MNRVPEQQFCVKLIENGANNYNFLAKKNRIVSIIYKKSFVIRKK